jgi:hypothetical protein
MSAPYFILATAISSALLVFLIIKWLLIYLRLKGSHGNVSRFVLIGFLVAIYIGVAIFHNWLVVALYREFCDFGPDVDIRLYVPVYPVWLVGIPAAVIFFLLRALHRRRALAASSRFPPTSNN